MSAEKDIELVDVSPKSTVATRFKAPMTKIGEEMGEAFGQVMTYCNEHGIHPTGMPYATYPNMSPDQNGEWEVICGMPVDEAIESGDDVFGYELSGGKVAKATHVGPYDTISSTYEAISKWISAEGMHPAGAMWEVYYTDPSSEPDPSKWRTGVFAPVAA